MSILTSRQPSYIDPSRLYSLRGFVAASGIAETRIRQARRLGIDLPSLKVGTRKFIRGSQAIEYIEKLAALEAAPEVSSFETKIGHASCLQAQG